VMTEVMRALNETGMDVRDFPIPATSLAELVRAVGNGSINRQAAKKVFVHMLEQRTSAAAAIRALGLEQISDSNALAEVVQRIVAQNQKAVEDYRSGKEKALHSLKGLVMRETRGKANPTVVEDLLVQHLKGAP
jgi:aspartyl-tRNA(Asn)/glutamyl-tRNA(Gln) amidotransferase subunit B